MHSRNTVNTTVMVVGLLMVLAAILMSGCATTLPDSLRVEYEHVSHPFAGPPFGPQSEEDWLDQAQVLARWQRGRVYSELGVGYSLTDGGFYGPKLTGTCRVGVELWARDGGKRR